MYYYGTFVTKKLRKYMKFQIHSKRMHKFHKNKI